MRTMSFRRKSSTIVSEDKDVEQILDSTACKRLFTWGKPKDAMESFDEKDEELREQQKLRWNFDFETETPLPGRYKWVRTDCSNGHHKNGDAEGKTKVRSEKIERKSSRTKSNGPYSRKTRPTQTKEPGSSLETAASCDTTLNVRRSERKVQLSNSNCRSNRN